jgi:hypothetical protein
MLANRLRFIVIKEPLCSCYYHRSAITPHSYSWLARTSNYIKASILSKHNETTQRVRDLKPPTLWKETDLGLSKTKTKLMKRERDFKSIRDNVKTMASNGKVSLRNFFKRSIETTYQLGSSTLELARLKLVNTLKSMNEIIVLWLQSLAPRMKRVMLELSKKLWEYSKSFFNACMLSVGSRLQSHVLLPVTNYIKKTGQGAKFWIWWWSLAAIAVYGISTTVPKELIRILLKDPNEHNKKDIEGPITNESENSK